MINILMKESVEVPMFLNLTTQLQTRIWHHQIN